MFRKGLLFVLVILAVVALYVSPDEQRGAVAKYLFFCLVAAIILKPVGLAIGALLKKLIKRE